MTKKDSCKLATAVINELGRKSIANELDITVNAVSNWKRRGIPKFHVKFIKLKHPHLKVWQTSQAQ